MYFCVEWGIQLNEVNSVDDSVHDVGCCCLSGAWKQHRSIGRRDVKATLVADISASRVYDIFVYFLLVRFLTSIGRSELFGVRACSSV